MDLKEIDKKTEWLRWATKNLKGRCVMPSIDGKKKESLELSEIEHIFGKIKGREMKITNKDNPLNYE